MRWYIATLFWLMRLVGRLPLSTLHRIGGWLGMALNATDNRLRRVADINLSLVITQLRVKTRHDLRKESLVEFGKSVLELCKIWSGDPLRALSLIKEVSGEDLLAEALAIKNGVIVAAPHLGCWEVLNFWLCQQGPIAVAYRPPRQPELEPLLIRARGALAAEQVRAEGAAGVRTLFKRLSAGGMVGILPDQQPKQGEGEFAPFFGVPALTMVLLSRLAQRTGATVLFAFAERLPAGGGYRIHILPAPTGIADPDLPTAVTALNRGIEDCVRLAPAQYQWHYKRYGYRPPGESKFY
jgi:Kdo2-lipid IVA lauroyltransferase/acyltransferase